MENHIKLEEFLQRMTPLQAGKARKVLTTLVSVDGRVMSRAEAVVYLTSKGYLPSYFRQRVSEAKENKLKEELSRILLCSANTDYVRAEFKKRNFAITPVIEEYLKGGGRGSIEPCLKEYVKAHSRRIPTLKGPDKTMYDVTKVEHDYAKYLGYGEIE